MLLMHRLGVTYLGIRLWRTQNQFIFIDSGLACHNPLNWEDREALTSFGNSNGSMPFKSYWFVF